MSDIWTMGEILVEIMRPYPDLSLQNTADFIGPFPSGAPAIFIDTVARLGHSGAIIGGVGKDAFGKMVLQRLQSDGVLCSHIQSFSDGSTAVAFVSYEKDGTREFIFHVDGTPAVKATFDLTIKIKSPLFFHIMGCSLMINDQFRQEILRAMRFFKKQGAKISFDPNIRPELLGQKDLNQITGPVLENCSILLPGLAELKLLTAQTNIPKAINQIFETSPVEIIVLKKGGKGSVIYTRDKTIEIPPYLVKEIDPTGAGDAFDAGFLCGLLQGKSLPDCGKLASATGALTASAFGPMEGKISPQSIKRVID